MDWFFFFVIIFLACCGLIAMWADSRGRSPVGFFFLSFFTSPILGGLVLALKSNLVEERAKEEKARRQHELELESVRAIAVSVRPAAAAGSLPSVSVADELAKLVALRDQGILTLDEFKAQKAALLRSTA